MNHLKDNFLIDPEVIFLNRGSFGACPRPVFEVYQNWQLELERQPVEFLGRRTLALLAEARSKLGAYLGCKAEEIVLFPNPTTAINMVVRNLDLQPNDEILTSNHEYGAMDRTWRYICKKTGAKYHRQTLPLPVTTQEAFAQTFWEGVTTHTRVIFLSHITSPTALIFPVREICQRAREAGIISIIDGAHAPGQIPLDLPTLGADIYTGACHKWMLSPKGSSFLYARKEVQDWLDPLVVSWGYEADPGYGSGNKFIDYHEWQGTRDLAAFLSVPAGIEFMERNHWDYVRESCHQLAVTTRQELNALTGLASICPEEGGWLGQMVSARLPEIDVQALSKHLYEEYRVEIPVIRWNDQTLIRVSIQGYNTRTDVDVLLGGLTTLLK
jgi:isopenicillin-N epimerase